MIDRKTRETVGKCAASIDQATAQELLIGGIPFPEAADEDDTPERIYAVYRGAIDEARPTIRGVSYHGYPWRGDLKGRRPLPKTILRRLRQMAEKTGYLPEPEQWLRKYSPRS